MSRPEIIRPIRVANALGPDGRAVKGPRRLYSAGDEEAAMLDLPPELLKAQQARGGIIGFFTDKEMADFEAEREAARLAAEAAAEQEDTQHSEGDHDSDDD